jgi:transcriptional regulator with XRE-family HTH domain
VIRKTRNRLKVLRAERGLVQYDVAERLGVNINRYWQIENDRTDPTADELKKLIRIFGVTSAEDIFPKVAA